MKSPKAKPLHGFGGAGVLEIAEDDDGNAYRAVYAVKFRGYVFVLHAFQKKSRRGIATNQSDVNLIISRLKIAQQAYQDLLRSAKP